VILLVISFGLLTAGWQDENHRAFGGSYAQLSGEQQRLLHEWADRYARLTGEPANPGELYDTARMSQRTTFDAVTHALLNTPLTDANGQSMGTALDLIESFEHVAGQEHGARRLVSE